MNSDGNIHVEFAPDLAARGTPHWWMAYHGLTNGGWTFDQAETNNPDGDFFTSADEYIADTDPTNDASYFCVSDITASLAATLYFNSSSNRIYTLQACTNLVEDGWIDVPGAGPRAGSGGNDSIVDTNEPARGLFYRLNVELL